MSREKFEKIIRTHPPFDKRNSIPTKNYGIGALEIWFILKGEKGAVQFLMSTDGYLPGLGGERKGVQGWDLGYHSPVPQYDGQSKMDCDILPDGYCYYDGTALGADKPLQIYITAGEEGLWEFLKEYYHSRFN